MNETFVRWGRWVVYPLDMILIYFLMGRFSEALEQFWPTSRNLVFGMPQHTFLGIFLAVGSFGLVLVFWYALIEPHHSLTIIDTDAFVLRLIRWVLLVGAVTALTMEIGVLYAMFESGGSNRLIATQPSFTALGVRYIIVITLALIHATLAFFTAAAFAYTIFAKETVGFPVAPVKVDFEKEELPTDAV